MAAPIAGHIVVRHPRAEQTWANGWRNGVGPEMDWITTNEEVATRCKDAMRKNQRVRFHRCAHSTPAVVCCEASVKDVQRVGRDYIVYFVEQVPLTEEPSNKPGPGQNWY